MVKLSTRIIAENAEKKTPHTKRGVLSTNESRRPVDGVSVRVSFDWVSVTFPQGFEPLEVIDALGLDRDLFEYRAGIYNFYQQFYRYEHITVAFDGKQENMGVHVDFTGQGCREYELMGSEAFSWGAMFASWFELGAHVTRLDVAFDDKAVDMEGLRFSMRDVLEAELAHNFVARSYRHGHVTDKRRGRHTRTAITCNFGSRQSDTQVVIYDKGAEQGTYEAWNRVELRVRRAKADDVVRQWLDSGEDVSVLWGFLNRSIRFVVPNVSDDNRSRWATADWWRSFLASEGTSQFSVLPSKAVSLDSKEAWLVKQVSKTFRMVMEAHGGDMDFVMRLLSEGDERLTDRERQWLAVQIQFRERFAS